MNFGAKIPLQSLPCALEVYISILWSWARARKKNKLGPFFPTFGKNGPKKYYISLSEKAGLAIFQNYCRPARARQARQGPPFPTTPVFVLWNLIFRNLLDAHTEMHLFHYYKSEQFAFEKSRHMQISLSTHLRFFFGSLNWRSPGGWRFTLMWSRVGRRTITCRGSTDSRSGTGRYRIIVSSGVRRSRRLQWF